MTPFGVFVAIVTSLLLAVLAFGFFYPSTGRVQQVAELRRIEPVRADTEEGRYHFGERFLVTNCSKKSVYVSVNAIEVKDTHGWSVCTNRSLDWRLGQLGPRQAEYGTVFPPVGGRPWRIHVTVSSQMGFVARWRHWARLYRNPYWRQRLGLSLWRMPPFGKYTAFEKPRLELVSEEIH